MKCASTEGKILQIKEEDFKKRILCNEISKNKILSNKPFTENKVEIICKKIQSDAEEIFNKKIIKPENPYNEINNSVISKLSNTYKSKEIGKYYISSLRNNKKDKTFYRLKSKHESGSEISYNPLNISRENCINDYNPIEIESSK